MAAIRMNNLDLLLRFVLASMVFLAHVHILSGAQELRFLSRYMSADLALRKSAGCSKSSHYMLMTANAWPVSKV